METTGKGTCDMGDANGGGPRPGVVIADDMKTDRRQLEIILRGETRILGTAADGASALALVEAYRPEIVIMDVWMPGMDGIEATREVVRRFPETSVVVVSTATETEVVERAMAAGAREYLFKPSEPEEIRTVVARLGRQNLELRAVRNRHGSMPARGIWTFCGASSGGDRTVLLLGMADELVAMGAKVAVVDLDALFGDITFDLGLSSDPMNLTAYAAARAEGISVDLDEFLQVHSSGLRVIGPSGDSFRAVTLDPAVSTELVRDLAQRFDYVLVNLPAGVPDTCLDVMDASRFLFPVGAGDISGLRDLKVLNRVLTQLGYRPEQIHTLVTRARRSEIESWCGTLRLEASEVFPEDAVAIGESIRRGQPVTRSSPRSPLTQTLRDLMARLLDRPQVQAESTGRVHSLFGRLLAWAA